jgi:hypothetical protein
MAQMWIEGGWGMFPVLIFGLVTLYASGRYAVDGEPVRLRFVAAMSVVSLAAMAHAMLTNVAAVFSYLRDPERAPDAELTRILFTGLMESTRPGALGGALLVLALVLVAVGVYRAGRKELRLTAA